MIELTRLNGNRVSVNPFSILYAEETPDTVIHFNTSQKIVVKEKNKEIQDLFAEFISLGIQKGIQKSK